MRFVFTPPADHAAGLLTLPWSEPLADWQDERLVEIRQRGISRHVVRFVYDDGTLYALKELSERLARREYRLLRALAELNIPAADVIVNPRGAFFLTRDAENISHWFTAHGLTGVRPEPGELASLLRRAALIDH